MCIAEASEPDQDNLRICAIFGLLCGRIEGVCHAIIDCRYNSVEEPIQEYLERLLITAWKLETGFNILLEGTFQCGTEVGRSGGKNRLAYEESLVAVIELDGDHFIICKVPA